MSEPKQPQTDYGQVSIADINLINLLFVDSVNGSATRAYKITAFVVQRGYFQR